MGFSKTTAAWLSVLGGVKNDAKKDVVDPDAVDVVDAMEQGFVWARDEATPEAAEAPKRKMHVERSQDRLVYVLYSEDGAPVLEARCMAEDIRVFATREGLKMPFDVPACVLTHDGEKKNWKIASGYCENCAYRKLHKSCKSQGGPTMALIRHAKEEIGGGVAMCMDVDIPEIGADGQSDIWCPLCNDWEDSRIELSSVRPKWNSKLKSLAMSFQKARVEVPSAKNFQLCLDDKVVLVFGKRADGTFCLDFEHPMSPVQAFTIALTTMYWA